MTEKLLTYWTWWGRPNSQTILFSERKRDKYVDHGK